MFHFFCSRVLLSAFLALLPLAAQALPEAELRARTVAEAWLKGMDAGRYAEAWESCAPVFREHVSRGEWVALLEQVRTPLGAVRERTLKRLFYSQELPDAPPANYVVIEFETYFTGRELPVIELITPVLVAIDGKLMEPQSQPTDAVGASWQVCGYYIKPQEQTGVPQEQAGVPQVGTGDGARAEAPATPLEPSQASPL